MKKYTIKELVARGVVNPCYYNHELICEDFSKMKSSGMKYNESIIKLSEKYSLSERTIKRALSKLR